MFLWGPWNQCEVCDQISCHFNGYHLTFICTGSCNRARSCSSFAILLILATLMSWPMVTGKNIQSRSVSSHNNIAINRDSLGMDLSRPTTPVGQRSVAPLYSLGVMTSSRQSSDNNRIRITCASTASSLSCFILSSVSDRQVRRVVVVNFVYNNCIDGGDGQTLQD